jgi:hypothetical protein
LLKRLCQRSDEFVLVFAGVRNVQREGRIVQIRATPTVKAIARPSGVGKARRITMMRKHVVSKVVHELP